MIKRLSTVLLAVLLLVLLTPVQAASAAPGVISWKGYDWAVRTWGGAPGKSGLWSAANVSIDSAGKLHLRITRDATGRLAQAELDSVKEGWGYGTYRWTVDTDLRTLHPEHVLGLFTYGGDASFAHREIDVEAAGWGRTPVNWDYSVQSAGGGVTKSVPVTATPGASTHEFKWEPGRVTFRSWDAAGTLVGSATETRNIPTPGDEQVMLNLWACAACSNPGTVPTVEVVLSDFQFAALGRAPAPVPTTAPPSQPPAPVVTPAPAPTVQPPVADPPKRGHVRHWWKDKHRWWRH